MNCQICSRIAQIKSAENPHFVAETETGYVVIGDFQFFRGYTLLLSKTHAPELHCLNAEERFRFLEEMSLVAECVYNAFHPVKLNYECLGNTDPHLHWHIFPRYADDPSPGTTSWKIEKSIRYNDKYRLSLEERDQIKSQLLNALANHRSLILLSRYKSG